MGLSGDSSTLGTLIGDVRSPGSGGGGHIQTPQFGGTGYTSYNKGDLLVGQGGSILGKLAIGTNGSPLVADSTQQLGIRWGNGAPTIVSVTGVWNKPSLINFVAVTVIGNGAGGGAGGSVVSGGGAGGGAITTAIFNANIIPSSVLIFVSVAAGGGVGVGSGSIGGTTYFGSILSAGGGQQGTGGNGGGTGGTGGTGGIGWASVFSGYAGGTGANGISGNTGAGGGGAGSGTTAPSITGVGDPAGSWSAYLGAGGSGGSLTPGGAGKSFGGGGAGGGRNSTGGPGGVGAVIIYTL